MIQHTINWYNGEIFEGRMIAFFGLLTIIGGLLFYTFGDAPTAKALLIPMIVAGTIFSVIGTIMNQSNQNKIARVRDTYAGDLIKFVDSEKTRVESFQYLYPLSVGISSVCFVLAVTFLTFGENTHLRATAIALVLFGSAFIVIDYFSKERAAIYYTALKSF